jgi:hypothetical protein
MILDKGKNPYTTYNLSEDFKKKAESFLNNHQIQKSTPSLTRQEEIQKSIDDILEKFEVEDPYFPSNNIRYANKKLLYELAEKLPENIFDRDKLMILLGSDEGNNARLLFLKTLENSGWNLGSISLYINAELEKL